MDYVQVKNGKIVLPKKLARKFSGRQNFILVADEDTLILRKVRQVKLSSIALDKRKSKDFISPEEINREIQSYRKGK